jgi:hypothetical protein
MNQFIAKFIRKSSHLCMTIMDVHILTLLFQSIP